MSEREPDEALDAARRARLDGNLAGLRARVDQACARAGRDPAQVALVAVTKYTGPDVARALLELGQRDLGENRTDHLASLDDALPPGAARWHLIGHLQRNKAKDVARRLTALHSLDSLDLARRLDQLRPADAPPLDVYVEVRLSREEGRSGVEPGELPAFLDALAPLGRLRLVGLMGLPPHGTPEEARPHFRAVRRLRDEAIARGLSACAGLSMGMTEDLEVAVEEGSTVVRVGRALIEGI